MIINASSTGSKIAEGLAQGAEGFVRNYSILERLRREGKLSDAQIRSLELDMQLAGANEARRAQAHPLQLQGMELGIQTGKENLAESREERVRKQSMFPLERESAELGVEQQRQQLDTAASEAPLRKDLLTEQVAGQRTANTRQAEELARFQQQLERVPDILSAVQDFGASILADTEIEDPGLKAETQQLMQEVEGLQNDPLGVLAQEPYLRQEMRRITAKAAEGMTRKSVIEQAQADLKTAMGEGTISPGAIGRINSKLAYVRRGAVDPRQLAAEMPHLLNNRVPFGMAGFPEWVDESIPGPAMQIAARNQQLEGALLEAQAQYNLTRNIGSDDQRAINDKIKVLLQTDEGMFMNIDQLQSKAIELLGMEPGRSNGRVGMPGVTNDFWARFDAVGANESAQMALLAEVGATEPDQIEAVLSSRGQGGPPPQAVQPTAPAATGDGTVAVPFAEWARTQGGGRSDAALRVEYQRLNPRTLPAYETWRAAAFPDFQRYKEDWLKAEYARRKKALE